MIKTVITYPNNALLTTTVNVIEMLTEANSFSELLGIEKHPFELKLVGEKSKMLHSYGNAEFNCQPLDDCVQDLVLVPAIKGDLNEVFHNNKRLINYIQYQYNHGATLVSICSGALLLAEAGILENKRAATHWAYADFVASRFPNIKFEFQNPFIDLGNIITSTGAFSSNAMIIYLVEKFGSFDLALFTSKMYLTDYNVASQRYFMPINLKLNHTNARVVKIQKYIIDHLSEISVEKTAAYFNMGPRNLNKILKSCLGQSASQYIQLVRIREAIHLIENTDKNIKEIMYQIGYSDGSAFRQTFKKVIGLNPSTYRDKFQRTQRRDR